MTITTAHRVGATAGEVRESGKGCQKKKIPCFESFSPLFLSHSLTRDKKTEEEFYYLAIPIAHMNDELLPWCPKADCCCCWCCCCCCHDNPLSAFPLLLLFPYAFMFPKALFMLPIPLLSPAPPPPIIIPVGCVATFPKLGEKGFKGLLDGANGLVLMAPVGCEEIEGMVLKWFIPVIMGICETGCPEVPDPMAEGPKRKGFPVLWGMTTPPLSPAPRPLPLLPIKFMLLLPNPFSCNKLLLDCCNCCCWSCIAKGLVLNPVGWAAIMPGCCCCNEKADESTMPVNWFWSICCCWACNCCIWRSCCCCCNWSWNCWKSLPPVNIWAWKLLGFWTMVVSSLSILEKKSIMSFLVLIRLDSSVVFLGDHGSSSKKGEVNERSQHKQVKDCLNSDERRHVKITKLGRALVIAVIVVVRWRGGGRGGFDGSRFGCGFAGCDILLGLGHRGLFLFKVGTVQVLLQGPD